MLQRRASECLARLRNAEKAKGGVDEARALGDLQGELARAARPLFEACAKAAVLKNAEIRVTLSPALAKHKQAIGNVATRFSEKPEAATLKQGKRWRTLLDAVGEVAKLVDESLSETWQAYIGSELFGGRDPDQEERLLAKTPANRRAMQEYRRLFSVFAQLRSSPPTTSEAIARLRVLSGELTNIKFQRDVPRSVREFLDAAGTPGGAPLNLLTEEVGAWLAENNLLESYVIRARIS